MTAKDYLKPKQKLSFVIPVYNGSKTIREVVSDILANFPVNIEIILVNDGSKDNSEFICKSLVKANPMKVRYVHLARNFSEHNAVLAGLNTATGDYIAVLDDDGQNPPKEILPMLDKLVEDDLDVVYGYFSSKKHSNFRNLGSQFNSWIASYMLKKPKGLYLSSFKVMNRFMVDEIKKYKGSFPYIDGLIFRSTNRIDQISVGHEERKDGQSGYTLTKLIKLWFNMFLNFSIAPLRLMIIAGLITSLLSLALLAIVIVEKLLNADYPIGIPSVLVSISFFAGMQLILTGVIGEYLGRLFLDQSGTPQYVIRYIDSGDSSSLESHTSEENKNVAIRRNQMDRVPIN
ncbi:MAG: glycosyltransferase family 2 protein [Pseudobacteriovorax sp.]|nr:glycosyltransferase family 2 protein [Pseudobacteriovorax sp.]